MERKALNYALSIASVAVAFALNWLFWPYLQHAHTVLFVAAVAISSLYGGLGPGLVATILSALLTSFFLVRPFYSFKVELVSDSVKLTTFVMVALIISWLNHARRRAEKELLRKSKETFRALVEASPAAVIASDRDEKVTVWNAAAERMFGWSQPEVLGRVGPFVPEAKTEERRVLRERLHRGEVFTGLETRRIRKDGSPIDVSISAAPLHDANGNLTGFMGVITDITERKRADEERERLIQQLQEALAKVKTLSGLLPICSNCKKVRDDKGYWNQIDEYIRDHSDAEFTHGLCPECLKELYPNFDISDEDR